jgi:hypothetical protein
VLCLLTTDFTKPLLNNFQFVTGRYTLLSMLVMQNAAQGARLPEDSAAMETPLISSAPPSPSHTRRRMSVNNIRSVCGRVHRYLTGTMLEQ